MESIDLSVVIPVYRSEETLPTLVERLLLVLNHTGKRFEIIFVEDGSPDNSWGVLHDLQRSYPDHIIAIQLMRNYGQHNATMCGFRHSSGKYVITMDDDLQHPPEEIPKLLTAIETNGMDLIYGYYNLKRHRAWRNMGSALANLFFKTIFGHTIPFSSFRIIRRELLESIFSYSLNFTYIDGLLAWNTQRIDKVAVAHRERLSGRSGYSIAKLAVLALNLFTNFSLLPLQFITAWGFLAAAGGLALGCYYLVYYILYGIDVPGYASIIIAVLVLGGMQLLSLGIMGEYLGRLHLNVNRKPQYVEREVLTATPAVTVVNITGPQVRAAS